MGLLLFSSCGKMPWLGQYREEKGYGSKWVGVRYSGAEEWWLELEAKCLHGSEVGGRENELAMPGV